MRLLGVCHLGAGGACLVMLCRLWRARFIEGSRVLFLLSVYCITRNSVSIGSLSLVSRMFLCADGGCGVNPFASIGRNLTLVGYN